MQLRAMVISCESREIETARGRKYLTELYLIDTDMKKNFYVGQIWGEQASSYRENEIVTFQVSGIVQRKKKLYLALAPEKAEGAT